MLVGQAPGQVETVGRKALRRPRRSHALPLAGARRGSTNPPRATCLYIAAITRCYPGPHPAGRGDRVPSPAERAQCSGWLDDELRIIRPALVIPVGRLAIDRFLGAKPLDEVVGREHEIEHVGGRAVAIPLPHPSGASSWIHQPGNRVLLERALDLLGARLGAGCGRARGVSPDARAAARLHARDALAEAFGRPLVRPRTSSSTSSPRRSCRAWHTGRCGRSVRITAPRWRVRPPARSSSGWGRRSTTGRRTATSAARDLVWDAAGAAVGHGAPRPHARAEVIVREAPTRADPGHLHYIVVVQPLLLRAL